MGVYHGDVGIGKGYLTVIGLTLLLDLHFLFDNLAVLRKELLVLSRHIYDILLVFILLAILAIFPLEELEKQG